MSIYVNQKKLEPLSKSAESPADASPRARFSPNFTVFQIPQDLLKERRIAVDWEDPNASATRTTALRFGPSVTEVWLLKESQQK
jgi:hypothetical protein